LIEKGVDLESPDNTGMTPIFYSYKHSDLKVAGLLSDAGASLSSRMQNNETQFLYTCEQGLLEAAKWISDLKGQKINQKSSHGATALHYACRNSHLELAQ
jgi:ankyrin repeat protein